MIIKFFGWLLLMNRLNTSVVLLRKNCRKNIIPIVLCVGMRRMRTLIIFFHLRLRNSMLEAS